MQSKLKWSLLTLVMATACAAYGRSAREHQAPSASRTFAGHSCQRKDVRENALLCLACNAYLEAGVQHIGGQVAVNRTVMTRMSRGWAETPCDVIYQRHQYSWTFVRERGGRRLPPAGEKLNEAIAAAESALKLKGNGFTNYFASYIATPSWARKCNYGGNFGVHEFFTCPGPQDHAGPTSRQLASEEEPSEVPLPPRRPQMTADADDNSEGAR